MTEQPKRIQRRRTKGWTMPDNTVYVGRPSKWGNPFRVGDGWDSPFVWHLPSWKEDLNGITTLSPALAVEMFKRWAERDATSDEFIEVTRANPYVMWTHIPGLRGKDLACWCPLDQPCHADVLLEWANAEPGTGNGELGTESTP